MSLEFRSTKSERIVWLFDVLVPERAGGILDPGRTSRCLVPEGPHVYSAGNSKRIFRSGRSDMSESLKPGGASAERESVTQLEARDIWPLRGQRFCRIFWCWFVCCWLLVFWLVGCVVWLFGVWYRKAQSASVMPTLETRPQDHDLKTTRPSTTVSLTRPSWSRATRSARFPVSIEP